MAAGIQRLSRQALVTFMTRETAAFSSNFERLKTMVSHILTVLNAQIHFEVVRALISSTCSDARRIHAFVCMCLSFAGNTWFET